MTEPIQRKFVGATTSIEGLAEKRQVLVNCSAEGVDRQGDIVVQSGINCASFMRAGGTVLWQHDSDQPIARAVDVGIDGGNLRSLVQFPKVGISPKADEIYGLIGEKVVNAVSIGFAPIEWTPIDPKEPWGGRKYGKIELMEFSFVSVPAMPDATVIARQNGEREKSWKVGASRTLPVGDAADEWSAEEAAESIFEHCGLDGDSPDVAFARKGFLVYDASAPKLSSSYLFPFAKMVDGRLVAMPAGVLDAIEKLGVTDPFGDVTEKAQAVLDHYEAKMKIDVDGKGLPEILNKDTIAEWLKGAEAFSQVAWLMQAFKDGRVLSNENMEHVKAMQKCMKSMGDCQMKALDSHGQTHANLEQFREHLNEFDTHVKALAKAGKKPPPSQDDGGAQDDDPDAEDDDANVELAAAAQRQRDLDEVLLLTA